MFIQQARNQLLDSELLTSSSGSTIFTTHRVDVALKKGFERFMRASGADRSTVEVTTVEDARFVTPSENADDFLPGNVYAQPFIDASPSGTTNDWTRLRTVSWDVMVRWYDTFVGSSGGAPKNIAWLGQRAYLYPVPDGEYKITFPYRRTFTSYEPGSLGEYASGTTYYLYDCVTYSTTGLTYTYINSTAASGNAPTVTAQWKQVDLNVVDPWAVSINCPDIYAARVIGSGCLYHLIKGVPGHAQWPAAGQEFEALIQEAAGAVTVDGPYRPRFGA